MTIEARRRLGAQPAWTAKRAPIGYLAVFSATLALRLIHLNRAYDIFLDETIYSRISDGAAVHGDLVFGTYQFYLHGPLSFYFQAALIRIFGIGGTAIQVIHSLRIFNAIVAAFIATLLFALVSRASSRRAGVAAAFLFALDPFIISYDSRLFIETFATLWVSLGYVILSPLARGVNPLARLQLAGRAKRRACIGGFVFGLALLSKETSAPLYVLPLTWCLFRGNPLPRGVAGRALLFAVATYSPYPVIAVATGGGSQFVSQKFGGVERLLGIVQATGFNRPGSPSFLSRLTADISTFGVTYALIGIGACGAVWLLRKGTPPQRVIGIWAAGAFGMMAFQIGQGTLEEQMFYYLVVPCIAVLATTAGALAEAGRLSSTVRVVCACIFTVVVAYDATIWALVHSKRDAAITDTVAWMQTHAPSGTRVAPLVDGIQFLLPDYRLLFDPEAGDVSPKELTASHAQLVITSSLQVSQRYSAATPSLIDWLRIHSRRRFSATGSTSGTVTVWQLGGRLPGTKPPGPEILNPRSPISLGASTYGGNPTKSGAFILGVDLDTGLYDTAALRTFADTVGVKAQIVQSFVSWGYLHNRSFNRFPTTHVESVLASGSTPEITWEPSIDGLGVDQPQMSLGSIIAGDHDSYIRSFAEAAKSVGQTILIRFASEMNGVWESYYEGNSNNQPGSFVKAWRHVYDIFKRVGATNVEWIWSPNVIQPYGPSLESLYPGDGYVDWVGIDGYSDPREGCEPPSSIFDQTVGEIRNLTSKPMMLAEVGVSSACPDKPELISDLFSWLEHQPAIESLTWWQRSDGGNDFALDSSPESLVSFKAGLESLIASRSASAPPYTTSQTRTGDRQDSHGR